MPGGLGTLDELFEAATLVQCEKIGPFPVVLVGTKFWSGLRNMIFDLAEAGTFAPEEVGFARIVDTAEEAVESVLSGIHPEVRAPSAIVRRGLRCLLAAGLTRSTPRRLRTGRQTSPGPRGPSRGSPPGWR